MSASRVRPSVHRLTDTDARHLLAEGLIKVCHHEGPSRVALEIGCDEKTVRRARDEDSTLGLACTFNLLDVDPHALDALAAAKGVRLVPLTAKCDIDALPSTSAAVHKLAIARSPDSPGGPVETDEELLEMETDLEAAEAALAALRSRIAAIKLRRAA